ncbi:Gfo/Idh/MocA family oxidoreductase [Actinoallomurus liliacearum]|uniref:Gfo/Idh/MocA family oxidoreductase n=1 Tax=Actinoallomurus liliacearum TaxID=1080073 RepID=A0ABP8TXH5_9ACTN
MIRAAIVGTGGIAGICHLPALRAEAHRARVVAAVDVDAARVKDFCAAHDVPAAYTDLGEMLAEARPDLVHVCTPPHVHAAQVRACLEAGAWVLCEKPPALSLAEYDAMTAAERDGGPYAAVVYQHRFGSGARHLRRLIADGELGRPLVAVCLTTWYRDQAYFDVPWRGRWDTEGGGPTMGHGIHQMDLLLATLGDWAEVRAMAGRLVRDVATEDASVASVRFENGALASVVNSVLSPREESRLRFDFTDATVELSHLYGHANADWTYTPAPHVTDEARVAAWRTPDQDLPSSHTALLADLLDAYERGDRPQTSGAGGRRTLELIVALYKSALTGRPVRRGEIDGTDPFYREMNGGRDL